MIDHNSEVPMRSYVGIAGRRIISRIGLLLFVVGIMPCIGAMSAQDMNMPADETDTTTAKCEENLKRIYRLIRSYEHHSGGALEFPARLEVLLPMAKDAKLFSCPAEAKDKSSDMSYEIVNDPTTHALDGVTPDRIVIVAEKRPNHEGKRLVLFYDGTIKALDDASFTAWKNKSFVDKQK